MVREALIEETSEGIPRIRRALGAEGASAEGFPKAKEALLETKTTNQRNATSTDKQDVSPQSTRRRSVRKRILSSWLIAEY